MSVPIIDPKYLVALKGHYARGVYKCPECDYDMLGHTDDFAIGFAYIGKEAVMITECQNCFELFYSHADQTTYDAFIDTQRIIAYKKAKGITP